MQADTRAEVRRLFAELSEEFDRPPMSTEIAEHLDVTPQRVRQIMASEGLQTYKVPPNRALEYDVLPTTDVQRRIVLNLRRLYQAELDTGSPRTDRQMAVAAGWTSKDPGRDANEFRRCLRADRDIGMDLMLRLAGAFDVDVSELVKPIEGE
jgi:hypothetical protein